MFRESFSTLMFIEDKSQNFYIATVFIFIGLKIINIFQILHSHSRHLGTTPSMKSEIFTLLGKISSP